MIYLSIYLSILVAKLLGCDIVVSKFKLQLRYYLHFRTNSLEEGMNPLSYELYCIITVLLQGIFLH